MNTEYSEDDERPLEELDTSRQFLLDEKWLITWKTVVVDELSKMQNLKSCF